MLKYYVDGTYAQMMTPPFECDGVFARYLPLRADMGQIQSFCDRYLNVCPDIVRFRALTPYVIFGVLSYPELGSSKDPNRALFSQTEVLFQLPLIMVDAATGRERLVVCDPYIFVSNPVSIAAGRELFGWPKEDGWFEPIHSTWSDEETRPRTLLSVGAMSVGRHGPRQSTLLEVTQEPVAPFVDYGRLPFALPGAGAFANLFDPVGLWRNAVGVADMAFWTGVVNLAYYRGTDLTLPKNPLSTQGILSLLAQARTVPVNLKQIPSGVKAGRACYQELIETPLEVTWVGRSGLLGARNQMLLDSSGGLRVHIVDDPARPIASLLGLNVERRITKRVPFAGPNTPDSSTLCEVSILKPVCPYWVECSFRQLPVNVLARRGPRGAWQVGNLPLPPAHSGSQKSDHLPEFTNTLGRQSDIAPPNELKLRNASIEAFSLVGDASTIARFLDSQAPNWCKLEPDPKARDAVHLLFWNLQEEEPQAGELPWFGSQLAGLYVPAVLTSPETGQKITGLYPAYEFADDALVVNVLRGALGGNLTFGEVQHAQGNWHSRSAEPLTTRVNTLIVEAYDIGQKARNRTLLELLPTGRGGADSPASVLEYPLRIMRLKQVPNAANLQQAMYQALMLTRYNFSKAPEPPSKGASKRLLRLLDCVSHPIVKDLGLAVKPPSEVAPLGRRFHEIECREGASISEASLTLTTEVLHEKY